MRELNSLRKDLSEYGHVEATKEFLREIKRHRNNILSIHRDTSEDYNPSTKAQDFKEVYCKRTYGKEKPSGREQDEVAEVQATNKRVAENADRLIARCLKSHKQLK